MKPCIRAILWCVLFTPTASFAQDAESVAEVEAAESRLSGSLGLDWTSQYFFRGIVQQTDGVIMQPSMEAGFNLFSGDGALNSVDLTTGLWTSLHSAGQPSNTAGPAAWYEADFYAGLGFTFADALNLGVTYTAYVSPNSAFATVHEVAVGLAYDDASLWEDTMGGRFGGFQPSLTAAFELSGQADGGTNEGIYLEAGLEPSVSLVSSDSIELGMSLPLAVGLSGKDYYEAASGAFGYFSGGLSLTAGLAFVPARFGSWEVGLGAQALVLSEGMRVDDTVEFIGNAGLSVGY